MFKFKTLGLGMSLMLLHHSFQTLLVKSLEKKNFPATRKVDFEKTTLIQLRLTYRGTSHLLSLTSSLAANEKDA